MKILIVGGNTRRNRLVREALSKIPGCEVVQKPIEEVQGGGYKATSCYFDECATYTEAQLDELFPRRTR